MLTIIVLALIAAAGYVVYKCLKNGLAQVETDIETDVQGAETEAKNVVTEVKAKL